MVRLLNDEAEQIRAVRFCDKMAVNALENMDEVNLPDEEKSTNSKFKAMFSNCFFFTLRALLLWRTGIMME